MGRDEEKKGNSRRRVRVEEKETMWLERVRTIEEKRR